ncbi:MAG TPA: hypothetical protein DCZ94_01455 [Lentisphaeria bacterium]|nr:hypothetical protein [Lentisphaeria bacterium]
MLFITAFKAADGNISLGDFEKDIDGWEYNGGWEFKGANGSLNATDSNAKTGKKCAVLKGDFTDGGSYVAMVKKLIFDPEKVSIWVKAPNQKALTVRITDSSGQTFQTKLDLKATDEWQEVVLEDFEKIPKPWGGAKDGKWHPPANQLWIMLSAAHNMRNRKTDDTIYVDKVSYVKRIEKK